MCLYVRSKVPTGSFPFYYYAKWDKGQQPRKKLNLEVITIPEIRSSQNLVLISEAQMQAGDKNPRLGEDFFRIGLNGIGDFSMGVVRAAIKGRWRSYDVRV